MDKDLEDVTFELRVIRRNKGNTRSETVLHKVTIPFKDCTLIENDNMEDRLYVKTTVTIDGVEHTTDVHLQGY